jgi:hypothetical protein
MGKFCLYADYCQDAPCIVIKMHKYSYLSDFLDDNKHKKNTQPYSVPLEIDCLVRQENSEHKFSINDERCINCMFCIMGCIGNRILISDSIHPQTFCYNIDSKEYANLKDRFTSVLLNGKFVSLPAVKFSHLKPKYKRFEDFTGVNETRNIAVWTANAMKYLSTSLEPRISLEVGVQIEQRDRGGRLDVTMLNLKDGYLFVAETKVSFDKMMSEGRYESQMLAYETELKAVDEYQYNRAKFLVIGGRESDLLLNNQEYSTSGPRGALFYEVLRKHRLFFFSANALLALALKKMFVSIEKYSLESIFDKITNGKYVGMLSCGFIRTDGSIENY